MFGIMKRAERLPYCGSCKTIGAMYGQRARLLLNHDMVFLAELLISFGLMLGVLITSNTRRAARFTGLFAGALMAIYVVVEAPYSGMSMNPARTLASAVPAQIWTGLWLYFAAPLLGMVLAGEVYLLSFGRVYCAKLHHDNDKRCIFCHVDESRNWLAATPRRACRAATSIPFLPGSR